MEIMIVERAFLGVDWGLIVAVLAAVGTLASALFTASLWWVARSELGHLREAFREAAGNHEEQLAELQMQRRQLESQVQVAEWTLRAQRSPVVVLRFAEVGYAQTTVESSFILGTRRWDVRAENLGSGPALDCQIGLWIEETANGDRYSGARPEWVFRKAPNVMSDGAFDMGAGSTFYPPLRLEIRHSIPNGRFIRVFWRVQSLHVDDTEFARDPLVDRNERWGVLTVGVLD